MPTPSPNRNFKITDYLSETSPAQSPPKLHRYAWPGAYPLYYLTADDYILCPECASKHYNDPVSYADNPIINADANWEDPELYCEDCGNLIESAYGDTPNTQDE